jgi:hypothetical protein
MHTSGGISGKRRSPLAAAPMGRRYKSRPLRPQHLPMSSALPIPQSLRRVRGARKRLPSENGGRLRRRCGGGGVRRRLRRLCGGVEEEARPLLCCRRQVHGAHSSLSSNSNKAKIFYFWPLLVCYSGLIPVLVSICSLICSLWYNSQALAMHF